MLELPKVISLETLVLVGAASKPISILLLPLINFTSPLFPYPTP